MTEDKSSPKEKKEVDENSPESTIRGYVDDVFAHGYMSGETCRDKENDSNNSNIQKKKPPKKT